MFLDFKFATFLQEKIGEKLTCKFIGIDKHAILELQRFYFLKDPGEADFNYNDLFGLRKVITV